MANDLKTMSDLFMGLMQGLDEDEDKKKGLIPGTNIPLPDPNSVVPPVLDQFQTPPPKAPYQDAGEYMRNYFASNQEALANREPIPRKDMLRSDGTTKSAQGFLGPFPDKYGKMMTEQTIGVEIDGKEVQMPAIVPTTTPDEIELLASGNVNWKSPRGQLIQDKAVANYRDRVSRGLSPYYQDGETVAQDVPPVQNVPQPTSAPVPSGQNVPKPVEVGGPAYSYGNLGISPREDALRKASFPRQESRPSIPGKPGEVDTSALEVDTSALEAFRPDPIGKDPSDFIPKPEPTFSQENNLPTWMGSPIDAMQSSAAPNAISIAEREIARLVEARNKGRLDPETADKLILEQNTIINSSKDNVKEYNKQVLADKTYKVQRLLDAGLVVEARNLADELDVDFSTIDSGRKLTIPDSPMIGLGGVPKPEPEPEVRPPLRVVTTEETEASGELIGSDTSKQVDESVKGSGVQPGGKVVTKTNTETEEEEVVVVDENGDEKPGFLKSLWNGIKDIAKEGFEDPSLRRALFAYTASRVLGYDGVTLASAVLENEWQKQAAQAKADLELEKAYGKTQAEVIKNKRMDYTTSKTMYDPKAKKNYAGFMNKAGDFEFGEEVVLPYPNDKNEMVMTKFPAGSTLPVNVLTKLGYSVGQGKSMAELQGQYLKFAQDRAAAVIGQIKQRNSSMESKQLDDLVSQMQSATDPNILSEPLMVFLSTLPAGADPTDKFVKEAAVNGIREWLKSFESGQTVDSKDLVGFLDAQRMKLDLTSNGIPQAYFKIPADKKGEAQVGNNALSTIMNGIENSPYVKDLGLSTPIILSKMADIYGKKVINEENFQSRMNGFSKDSFSAGEKSKFVSPFFAFVQKSFASDNEDIAELMAELKK